MFLQRENTTKNMNNDSNKTYNSFEKEEFGLLYFLNICARWQNTLQKQIYITKIFF